MHDSYDELVSRLASMTMSLENEKAKIMKLENENSFLKNSCEEHKKLLDALKAPFASLKKQAKTVFWLICCERKTLFRLKKQAEKDGL